MAVSVDSNSGVIGYQSSLTAFNITSNGSSTAKRVLTKKGKTLRLYSPEDVAAHTPCSIIHNFLPTDEANALLKELLDQTHTFSRDKFKLFDEQWQPKVIAEMNDYQFKVVKLQGDFVWHDHKDTDETFIVLDGVLSQQCARRVIGCHVEDGGYLPLRRAIAHERGVAAGAERQRQRVEKDRLSGARH